MFVLVENNLAKSKMLLTPAPFPTPAGSPNGQFCWQYDGEFVDILAFLCEMILNRPCGSEMLVHSVRWAETDEGTRLYFTANWDITRMRDELANNPNIPRAGLVYLGTPTNRCLIALV
jgi:hypothetical protein